MNMTTEQKNQNIDKYFPAYMQLKQKNHEIELIQIFKIKLFIENSECKTNL